MQAYAARFGIEDMPEGDAASLRLRVSSAHEGRIGYIHGGALAGLLEAAAIGHARRIVGADRIVTRVSMTIDFCKGARIEELFAGARTCSLGRRLIVVDAALWPNGPATPVATAHCHFMLEDAR